MPRTTTDWFLLGECVWIDGLVEQSSGANRALRAARRRSAYKGSVPMIVPFTDSVAGTKIYIKPDSSATTSRTRRDTTRWIATSAVMTKGAKPRAPPVRRALHAA